MAMNQPRYICCFLLMLLCCGGKVAYSQDHFDRIAANIIQYLKADADTAKVQKAVSSFQSTMLPNGSWADIAYASKAETNWVPLMHLTRLKQFALLLAMQHGGQQQLEKQTLIGLRYWLQANSKSNNWFQNDIAAPTALGEILILLQVRKLPSVGLRDSLLAGMKQINLIKAVGANKLDIAVHFIYRACITRDNGLMDTAVNQAFMPVSLSYKEGLQPDYSYRQHGPQLQIASYGQVFLTGEYKVASWLVGTPYAMPAAKLTILDRYLLTTYLKTIRGRYSDFNIEGRGISRNDVLDRLPITTQGGKNSLLALARTVNPDNARLLDEAETRITQKQAPAFQVTPAHAFFYKSDYTLHVRPTYSFNVRTVSKRTIRTEAGNKENITGKFLPDGATNIQVSGSEYNNIMPIWEWDKIPGITARDYAADQKTTLEWGERGVGAFTGGASDGQYGLSVYGMDYNEVTAKKAWFFFDDEVVCLGAGINSYAREAITTTVNQSWQKGPVSAYVKGKVIDVSAGISTSELQWLWHDGIGYSFPEKGKISLTTGKQSGSWAAINANRSADILSGKVFKLWFNHGVDPVDQSYAYIVKPGLSEKAMMAHPTSPIRILANTGKLQAVEHTDLQMVQVAFYEAGTLTAGSYTITVDQPCVLFIKNVSAKNPVLYLSDPTQSLTDLHLGFSSAIFKVNDPISVSLPQGDYKGSTVRIDLNPR